MEIIRSETTIIGLFGDEMQAIYPDGVGQVTKYIEQGILKFVPKKDNYRCSYPVVALLNTLRFDGINQRVALKKGENIGERQGSVNLFYYVYDRKPSLYSRNRDEKVEYLKIIDSVINYVIDIPEFKNNAYKKLMLSNRAVAKKLKFDGLYDVFASRYSEVKDEMEKACANLMWLDLVELCFCYELGKHSLVVEKLQKNGYRVSDYTSKQKICDSLEYILNNNLSIKNAMEYAIKNKLIAESESRESYIFRTKEFLKMISIDVCFLKFQQEYAQYNTAARMRSAEIIIDDEDFLEQEKNLKKVLFYQRLLSNEISFNQIKNYYTYLNDETEYVTMHKTKGTGIENVLVVVEEYFWASRYNFNLVFTNQEGTLRKSSQKLFYVACSRTKKNLGILRVIVPEEEASLRELFKMCHITKIDEKSISCSLISKGGEET
jgi:DNA helicase-2/ATP-dependent DNA helicase PcrA